MNEYGRFSVRTLMVAMGVGLGALAVPARGESLEYIYTFTSDVDSWDDFGAPGNVLIEVDLTSLGILPEIEISAIGYDVTIEAYDPSWLDEATVEFNEQISLSPGFGEEFPGLENYASDYLVLADFGLPNIVISDGILSMYFFEFFDDNPGEVDGRWLAGSTISFMLEVTRVPVIPEPSTLAMTLVGATALGFVGVRRSRRRAAA